PLLVLGSLRPGEAAPLARAWLALPGPLRGAWQVAAVPRHPRASAELAAEARAAGQPVARVGEDGGGPSHRGGDARRASAPEAGEALGGAWAWDDRTGVLNSYYAAADVAFVGGSLLPYGGHNPLEPAAAGAAVVIGPHHPSQAEAVRALERREAVRIAAPGAALAAALRAPLRDAAERPRHAAAALFVAEEMRGAARRAVGLLAAWKLWPPA